MKINFIEKTVILLAFFAVALAVVIGKDAVLDVGFWTIILKFIGYIAGLIALRSAYLMLH